MELKDSGNRREFSSGAVRDINEGKGRCDLLPLDVLGELYGSPILTAINKYIRTGQKMFIVEAVKEFSALQYGCQKYGERNWEKGIPLHCYIDSGVRHYIKWKRGDTDEPHDRAFLWNMLGAVWTHNNLPEFCDLPFSEEVDHDRERTT